LINYVLPNHFSEQTAVHLTIRFGTREVTNDTNRKWIPAVVPIPGPLVIGAGRHCGFGVLAAV
jgi:hypothetical protein